MTRAEQRLIHERRLWRLGHPHDLHARPQVLNGGVDLFTWECSILGRKGVSKTSLSLADLSHTFLVQLSASVSNC